MWLSKVLRFLDVGTLLRSTFFLIAIATMAASKVVEKEADDKGNEKLLDDFLKEAGV